MQQDAATIMFGGIVGLVLFALLNGEVWIALFFTLAAGGFLCHAQAVRWALRRARKRGE